MGIDLYYFPMSAACRQVQLAAKNLGIEVTLKHVDLFAGETRTPEYMKINPLHQVPAMDDNGFYLAESKAIMQYLANAYGKDDKFYPKVTKKRAKVDQWLAFDQSFYGSFATAYYPGIFEGAAAVDPEKVKKLDENLAYVESVLKETPYVTGEAPTLADFAVISTLTTVKESGHPMEAYPSILEYLERCRAEVAGYEDCCEAGAIKFGELATSKLAECK